MFRWVVTVKEGKELHLDSDLGWNLSSATDFFYSFTNFYIWQKIAYDGQWENKINPSISQNL